MLAYTYDKTYTKPHQIHPEDEDQSEASPVSEDEDDASQKKVGKWTPEEDELLRKYAPMYDEKQWRKISNHIPGRSSIQCLHRWTKILKPGLVKGPWTAEEDQRLLTWVRTEGPTKWAQAANFIKGRSGKQCRERWFNNLSPNVKKGNWSKMEDELIFELYQKYGTSWSKIAKYLPGRTENAIKNRFYSTLRKLAADKRKVKNELPHTESVKSSEHTEELKHVPLVSTPGAAANILGVSSRLYKLLQDTNGNEDDQNELRESSTREDKERVEYEETSNNESPLKASQNANDKVKKFVTKQEAKTLEQTTYGAPTRASQGEYEDNDLIFEKFLLSLNDSTEEDFLLKELDSNCDSDDVLHYDELQQKILGYCQDNIQGLAEAFKNIANNDIEVSVKQDKNRQDIKMKGIPQILPRQSSNISVSKIEGNSGNLGNLYQQNIKGIKISAPIPVTHIGSNKKVNHIDMVPSAGSVSSRNAMLYSKKNDDGHGQGYLMMPNSGLGGHSIQLDGHDILGHMAGMETRHSSQYTGKSQRGDKSNVKGEELQNTHINALNNLLDKAQEVGSKNNSEGEKRMTFLFQQLHSLEDLLTSTRNELMKLEGAYNSTEGMKENLGKRQMSEEIFIDGMKAVLGNGLKAGEEACDTVIKKRKRS